MIANNALNAHLSDKMSNSNKNYYSTVCVTKGQRLTKLHETSCKLSNEEEKIKNYDNDLMKIKRISMSCAKCRGDCEKSEFAHIEDLCPADKQHINELIERLTNASKEKQRAEESLTILNVEKQALENHYEVICNKKEDEKNQLKLQLASVATKENQLRLQTSQSVDLLTQQIKAQERQFTQLTTATKSLIHEKSQLEKALSGTNANLREAEARVKRVQENAEMERLMLLKEYMQKLNIKTEDRACQT